MPLEKMQAEAVLKIPQRDAPPASKGTNLLLTLSHTPSANTGFKERGGLPSELAKLFERTF
ncbi:hypothetical protein [Thermocrinis sp.]|jgi:hypothetical protein|uniref:hypothetical protein n=1 Tax=Thermocrinis sp. TaxID=2024383 RepID=UPI003C74E800